MPSPKKPPDEPPGAPAWMMTFSDITTLLLTFFILIMTFSTIEKEQFEKAKGSFKGALGVVADNRERSRPAASMRQPPVNDRSREDGATMPRRVPPTLVAEQLVRLRDLERCIELDRDDRNWRVGLPTAYAFRPGSAEVRERARRIYVELGRMLRDYPNILALEGHTDGSFLPTAEHPTAWDLAADRAAAVARILEQAGVPADRLHLRSLGDSQPVAPNDTTMQRARNRRVDLLVLGANEKGVDR
jgi:chemotaxis protein MotB